MLTRKYSFSTLRLVLLSSTMFLIAILATAQTTISTGSIVGNVTDPQGAVVSGAKVTITNVGTGQAIGLTTNSAGAYNSGALQPGSYTVQISGAGFRTTTTTVQVQVGNTATVFDVMTITFVAGLVVVPATVKVPSECTWVSSFRLLTV